jgi:hypothetical protein
LCKYKNDHNIEFQEKRILRRKLINEKMIFLTSTPQIDTWQAPDDVIVVSVATGAVVVYVLFGNGQTRKMEQRKVRLCRGRFLKKQSVA